MNEASVRVRQVPVEIIWECEECLWENSYDFSDDWLGNECCDWKGSKVKCEECGTEHIVDDIEWD